MAKKQPTFEEKLMELEGLIRKMEGGILPLDETLKAYEDGMKLSKKSWGEYYVSFFPLGEPVEGLTLSGFQYPLNDFRLALREASLTISNRIVDDYAEVHFKNGDLVVMITTD